MRRKLVIGMVLFLSCGLNSWAFEAKLTSSETNIDINDYFTIKLDVSSDDTEEISIEEININGLDNFNVVSRSQGQSASTNISVVNGKAETIYKSVNSIVLTLSPKVEGEFQIGPAEIKSQSGTLETNNLTINVNPTKIIQNGGDSLQEVINKEAPKVEKELPSKYTIYFLIFGLLIIFLGIIMTYYKQGKNTNIEIGLKKNEDYGEKDEVKIKEEDFEEEKKLEYPKIDDRDFVKKIEDVLKSKISKKYNIKNINKKTYTEILEGINDEGVEKKSIREIYDMINKLKYSNILISKAELLDMVKRF